MDEVRVAADRLRAYCAAVFVKLGVRAPDAEIAADVLVAADARGISSHGVARLGRYVSGLADGQMAAAAEPTVLRESPTSILIDARGSMGAPAAHRAMRSVLEKARASGMAFGCVRDSNHYGIAAYYAMMALPHDMIGLSMTNTAALGVPTDARQVMFGTNPIAFAAPAASERPFVLDMSTTVVTRGKIEVYDREGKTLPDGWAVDKEGRTAHDPRALLDDMFHRRGGGIVPLGGATAAYGGHKGYGLAVMVDILTGVLGSAPFGPQISDTEASSARVSQCFAAMRIDLFRGGEDFKAEMDRMLGGLRSLQPAAGADRVYYAGLREFEAEDDAKANGVRLPAAVWKRLEAIGAEYGVGLPAVNPAGRRA
jgi:LDH2 family malate/lactate/ureidoglycolate dehydrogenase